jgi:hypothetical protein
LSDPSLSGCGCGYNVRFKSFGPLLNSGRRNQELRVRKVDPKALGYDTRPNSLGQAGLQDPRALSLAATPNPRVLSLDTGPKSFGFGRQT